MACCGQRRAMAASAGKLAEAGAPRRTAAHGVLYEYTGSDAMTVIGPASRSTYRFGERGARLQIDPRDAAAMAGMPDLRRL